MVSGIKRISLLEKIVSRGHADNPNTIFLDFDEVELFFQNSPFWSRPTAFAMTCFGRFLVVPVNSVASVFHSAGCLRSFTARIISLFERPCHIITTRELGIQTLSQDL